jgi:hypothetical protein
MPPIGDGDGFAGLADEHDRPFVRNAVEVHVMARTDRKKLLLK